MHPDPATDCRPQARPPRRARPGLATAALALCALAAGCAGPAPQAAAAKPAFDAPLAQRLGANDAGMRSYVLVILKTGPTPQPAGPARDAMFRGHFANIQRLADAGRLVMAGPLDGKEGRRGIFVFAVKDIDEARQLAESDPVLVQGEMAAEYHRLYGSAALMLVREIHPSLVKPPPPAAR